MISKKNKGPHYHHGNLYDSLLEQAYNIISSTGVESLSLRKLAEKVGVSRTAAYHHFKDKNDLLSAVAKQGFTLWQITSEAIFNQEKLSDREKFTTFVHKYVHFATENPALYELMFGQTLWKTQQSSQALKDVAYPSFHYQVKMTKIWQEKGLLPASENTLRLAQVNWATLHGIAHLLIDGIYADINTIDEMCDCVVNVFLSPH